MRGVKHKTTLELKLDKLRLICEKAPDNSVGLLALAETAFRRGLRLEALEAYQKVLRHESVAEAHLCMAQMYLHHGLAQEAIAELRALFQVDPIYPEAHVFARQLQQNHALPDDMSAVLARGCGAEELALARVRLSIARMLVLNEGQQLAAIQDAQSGDPTYGFYVGETRKRLAYCEQVLSQLGTLEDARRTYLSDQERQRQIEAERERERVERERAEAERSEQERLAAEAAALNPVPELAPDPVEAASVELTPDGSLSDPSGEVPLLHDSAETPAPELADPLISEPNDLVPAAEDAGGEPASDHAVFSPSLEMEESHTPALSLNTESASLDFHPSSEVEEAAPAAASLWDDPVATTTFSSAEEAEAEAALRPETAELSLSLTPSLDDVPELQPVLPPVIDLPAEQVAPSLELGSPEPPSVEAAPAAELPPPAVELPPPVVESPPAAVEPAAPPKAAFSDELYAALLPTLEGLLATLAKTRGVSSVFLVTRHGHAVALNARDEVAPARISEFVTETVTFLEGFAASPQYWVLECAGGIVVLQAVDNVHFLLTIGQTGANFGALRYTMDRVRPSFAQALAPVTAAL